MLVRRPQDLEPISKHDAGELSQADRDHNLPDAGSRSRAVGQMCATARPEEHGNGAPARSDADGRLPLGDDRPHRKHGGQRPHLSIGCGPVEGGAAVEVHANVLDRDAGRGDRRRQDGVAGCVRVDGTGRHHAHAEGERQHDAERQQALSDQASEQEAEHRHP